MTQLVDLDIVTIFYIAWIVVTTFILITFYRKGKKALSIFPDIKTVTVLYRDKTASGYSTKTWKTKMGGAQNVLDIVVTDKELWFKSMLLFAGIGKMYDLLHKIPLNNIIGITQNDKKLEINFKTENGEDKQLIITTKKPIDFINAIKKNKHNRL